MTERLTPNLRSMLIEWTRLYLRDRHGTVEVPYRPLRGEEIGSPSTMAHLVRKGWMVRLDDVYGPRGGTYRRFAPTQEAIALVERLDAKYGDAGKVVEDYFAAHHGSHDVRLDGRFAVEEFVPGSAYRPVGKSALLTAEGLRKAEARGVTSFAVTAWSRNYERLVTADFSIGELIRASH